MDIVIESIKELGLEDKTVGIELDYIPVSYYESLKEQLPNVKFINVSNLFIQARSIKEDDEIEVDDEI